MRWLLSLLAVSFASAFAQPSGWEWSQRYNGERWEEKPQILERAEGGYAICYTTTSYGVGDMNIRLVLTDSLGNIESAHLYGGVENEEFREFHQTTDGGFIIIGSTGSYGQVDQYWAAWIVKTDSNGDGLWTRYLQAPNNVIGKSICETPDEGYLALATAGTGYNFGFWLLWLNQEGDSTWGEVRTTYQIADTFYVPNAWNIHRTMNDDYLITGRASASWPPSCDPDAPWEGLFLWMMQIDSSYDSLWTRTHYVTGAVSNIIDFAQRNSSQYTFLAYRHHESSIYDADAQLFETDSEGNFLSSYVYGDEWYDEPKNMVLLDDGGILISGQIGHGEWTTKNWLMKVSAEGDSLWSYEFGDTDRYNHASIAPTSDGGFVVATTRQEYSGGEWDWLWDIQVFKFGPEGLRAGEQPTSFIVHDLDLHAYPNPFNPTTTITFDLRNTGPVSLVAYDLMGRVVTTLVDRSLPAGTHAFQFDAASLVSGSYFIQLRNGNSQLTRKITLLR